MPDKLRIDYNILNDAKADLTELAGDIKPLLDQGLFSKLTYDDGATSLLGSADVAYAVGNLHDEAKGTLGRAHDGLVDLANSFGSVGEAFLQFDSELAQGLGVMGHNLGLDNWRREKSEWDYYQGHKDECKPGPDGKLPGFCGATDPGAPPLDQVIKTDRGEIHTHLTVDDHNNVVREDSTVTYDGKTYKSVTDYSNDHNTIVTTTTYPDGSTVHNETYLKPDGSGDMYTRNSDGSWSNWTRGPKDGQGNQPDWTWSSGSDNPNDKSGGTSNPPRPDPPGKHVPDYKI